MAERGVAPASWPTAWRACPPRSPGLPLLADVVRAIWRYGLGIVYRATARIVASLDRIRLFRVTNWLTRNRMPPRESPHSSIDPDNCAGWTLTDERDEVPAAFDTPPSYREDVVAQNQLTLVTVIAPRTWRGSKQSWLQSTRMRRASRRQARCSGSARSTSYGGC
jgi:hypothetical protein